MTVLYTWDAMSYAINTVQQIRLVCYSGCILHASTSQTLPTGTSNTTPTFLMGMTRLQLTPMYIYVGGIAKVVCGQARSMATVWATMSVISVMHIYVHTCVLAHNVWVRCFISLRPSSECSYHYALAYSVC